MARAPVVRLEGRLLRAARVLLGWSVDDMAKASTLGSATIKRAEHDGATTQVNADRLRSTLEGAGIEFLPRASDRGVGLRMRTPDG